MVRIKEFIERFRISKKALMEQHIKDLDYISELEIELSDARDEAAYARSEQYEAYKAVRCERLKRREDDE